MPKPVILSADATCDLGPELAERYGVHLVRAKLRLGDTVYTDGVDIFPDDIYAAWREKGLLPQTGAVTPLQYAEHFAPLVKDGCEVVHLTLGSGITGCYQNACIVAAEMPGVYPIDSANLSSGFGLLVIRAAELIAEGKTGAEVQAAVSAMQLQVHSSFVIDTLEFMRAGGRCSTLAAFGANLLNLKPSIVVDSAAGAAMGVGKKYRGNMEKVLPQYVKDQLADRNDLDLSRIFITHAGSPDSDIALVREEIAKYAPFNEVLCTQAGCTISSHSGPRTLGVLYMTKPQ